MIWDVHGHLAGVGGLTPHERMARLIDYANRMGIARVTLFMGWPMVHDPSPAQLQEQNDQVLDAISHWHDRALGFVYVNPRHEQASLDEIDRCVRDGPLVGLKLWVAVRASEATLDRLVNRAVELHAPILQHTWLKATGNLPGESTPADLVALARRHPDAQFICGHTGGDWELGIRTVRPARNISIDLGGFDPTAGVVEMAVRELGADRVLFGSDAGGRSFASQLAKVTSAQLPADEHEKILGANYRRLVSRILQAKGQSAP